MVARKHNKRSTPSHDDASRGWTPFRAAEKKYKALYPPPDFSNVLDLANPNPQVCRDITPQGGRRALVIPTIPGLVLLPSFLTHREQRQLIRWALSEHAKYPNETNLDVHYHLPKHGLWNLHLHSLSSASDHTNNLLVQPKTVAVTTGVSVDEEDAKPGPRKLINNIAADQDNLSIINSIPKPPAPPSTNTKPTPASALVKKLRWANIGWYYHWGSKQYDFTRGKGVIDEQIRGVCKSAVASIDWQSVYSHTGGDFDEWKTWNESYEPDAGIVNFYQVRDTLMAHVDRSEVCATSPLVSISLGNSAIFLIGGASRDVEPTPILLRSGDIVIMSGPNCRRAYHGVPRVIENTLPEHLEHDEQDNEWGPYAKYLSNSRINVNVRQVFPKEFDPGLEHRH